MKREEFLSGKDFKLFRDVATQAQKKSACLEELKAKAAAPKTYRVICILDSVEKGEGTLSSLDASPGYLHIHAISTSKVQPISEFKKTLSDEARDYALLQWGRPEDKEKHRRTVKVGAAEVGFFGQVGIGSAACGDEREGTYTGGGEGFLFGKKKSRITKGGSHFRVGEGEGFWIFQAADFNGAISFPECSGMVVSGREELSRLLMERANDEPFVAVFDAEFDDDSFVRSNGVFPKDDVPRRDESLFKANEQGVSGGHVVGGSAVEADLQSLGTKLDAESAASNDFKLVIRSEILLKPVDELLIARGDGTFERPRTEVEVEEVEKLKAKSLAELCGASKL